MVDEYLPPPVPHSRYTHDVIELTDGRWYCLACDQVVAEEGRSRDEATAGNRSMRSASSGPTSTGT